MGVIKSMFFELDKMVWGVVLDVCRIYNNVGFVYVVVEVMLRFELESLIFYVLLYNMYVDMGLWDEVF